VKIHDLPESWRKALIDTVDGLPTLKHTEYALAFVDKARTHKFYVAISVAPTS